MDETFKIPGLQWEDKSVQQSKIQQNFISQEFARWNTKEGYLARLQYMKVTPAPIDGPINPHDPCATGEMIKIEWNNINMTQVKSEDIKSKNL